MTRPRKRRRRGGPVAVRAAADRVEIRIRRDGRSRLSSFSASGHAGWAESGSDVVCAAVSTLLQAAWLGLVEVAEIAVAASKSDGRLDLAWDAELSDRPEVRAVAETAARSLAALARDYPANVYVVEDVVAT